MPSANHSKAAIPFNRNPEGLNCKISFKDPSRTELAVSSILALVTAGQKLAKGQSSEGTLFKVSSSRPPKKIAEGSVKGGTFSTRHEVSSKEVKDPASLVFIPKSAIELYRDLHSLDACQIVDLKRIKPPRIKDLYERLTDEEKSANVGIQLRKLLSASKRLSSLQKLYPEGADITLYHIDDFNRGPIVHGKVRDVAGHTFEAAFRHTEVSKQDCPGVTLKVANEIWIPSEKKNQDV